MQEGDLLYLTKPLGSGMLSSALKRGKLDTSDIERLISWLTTANRFGEGLGQRGIVHAMTDVTGFGLLGHSLEMCTDELGVRIAFDQLPLMDEGLIKSLSAGFVVPNNTMRNFKAFHERSSKLSALQLHVVCDPQTSGGLLIAVDPEEKTAFEALAKEQAVSAHQIGSVKRIKEGEKAFELS